MNILRNNKGVTLVEAVVAGILATIVVAVIVTMFNIFSGQVREGTSNTVLAMQLENVVDDISRAVRQGAFVIGESEDALTFPYQLQPTGIFNGFSVRDNMGVRFRTYTIDNGKLRQGTNWNDTEPFQVGSKTVMVANANPFKLSADRKSVTLDLRLTDGKNTLHFGGGTFRCRN